jgi:hypothetical protein
MQDILFNVKGRIPHKNNAIFDEKKPGGDPSGQIYAAFYYFCHNFLSN